MNYITLFILILCLNGQLFAQDSLKTDIMEGQRVIIHKVEPGQTLFSIARKYNVSVAEIKEINPGITQIKSGSNLNIPSKGISEPTISKPNEEINKRGGNDEGHQTIHKVEPGETLYRISKIYNVPVAQISEANQIGSKGISPGQELLIPTQNKQITISPLKTTNQQTHSVLPQPIKSEKKTSLTGYPAITETGTAKLDESIPVETYLVLHKSAKVGTLIMLKNKETGLVAHAKVTGTSTGQELVIINKKVYDKLEGKNKSLIVEVFYTPEN
ncbi:MAG: LysM peptidoglycan-binding domain-containing protein [Opitutaceae bacterium]|nr:LysM peptidoglycan-binding domain-containing protein [Cytophagales bacterium]